MHDRSLAAEGACFPEKARACFTLLGQLMSVCLFFRLQLKLCSAVSDLMEQTDKTVIESTNGSSLLSIAVESDLP